MEDELTLIAKQIDESIENDNEDQAAFFLAVKDEDMKMFIKGSSKKICGLIANLCVEKPIYLLAIRTGLEMAQNQLHKREQIKNNPNIN